MQGVERCTQYWPEKLNFTESYGDYEVTMKEQQRCGDYVKRTFDLVHTGLPKNVNIYRYMLIQSRTYFKCCRYVQALMLFRIIKN